MCSESVTDGTNSERDARIIAIWILSAIGTAAMLHYEYLWCRFTLGNLASVSIGGWFWTILTIATPWNFCLLCLLLLRSGLRSGSVGRDICLNLSMFVEMVMLSAYWMLAPEIHHLTSLGVLN